MHRRLPARSTLILPALLCACIANAGMADDGRTTPVTVTPALQQEIHRVLDLTGTVTPMQSARLSVATSGLVSAMHVEAGSTVESGQLLLELDPELARLQVDSAAAQMEQMDTALNDARRRLEEARKLIPQRSIAESAVRDLEAEVAGDQAALHQARADLAYRQGILARHQLHAPFNGVVSAKLTELGEWVTPGQAVLELVGLQDVRLDFAVAEDYLADIDSGAPLSFSLNADPSRVYTGHVVTAVPVTNTDARTFLLRVEAQNPERRLLPGMSVRASLKLASGHRGLVVPRDSLLRFPDGRVVVWTIENNAEGAVARENTVRTGLAFDSLVEIREGLAAGATVVVEGNEALQDGQRVSIHQREPGD